MTKQKGQSAPAGAVDAHPAAAIEDVAVLGAGTMGHGIAQVVAQVGCRVRLYDLEPEILERALAKVRGNLDKGVSLGKVDPEVRDRVLAGLSTTTDLEEAVEGADLVIEAVPERLELKREVFRRAEAVVGSETLLATNTSSLSVGRIGEALDRPERSVGLHFFNPVYAMALVEVVRAPATSDDVVERSVAFARRIGKEPVVVRDSPGFATSRLGLVLGLEAMRMVEEGVASAEDIDRAMVLGYRHPMGPLKLTDLVGLDIRLGIAEYLYEELESEAFRPPEILRTMVDEGKLGKKSGEGFYTWGEGA